MSINSLQYNDFNLCYWYYFVFMFQIISVNTAPHLAGHTSSVVDDFMLVFGGSMGRYAAIWISILTIKFKAPTIITFMYLISSGEYGICLPFPGKVTWHKIWLWFSYFSPCPSPRYGHSQILLDKNHLVIIGGCCYISSAIKFHSFN